MSPDLNMSWEALLEKMPTPIVWTAKTVATLFTIAVILVRYYVATVAALVAAGAWWELGPWGIALGAVVPGTWATARMADIMRRSGMTNVWRTLVGLWRARDIKAKWNNVAYQLKLTGRGGDGEPIRLVNVRPTDRGVTGDILTGHIALDAQKLVKLEREFASGFFCDRVTIKAESPYMATVSWEWGHHLRKTLRTWEVPAPEQTPDKPALAAFGIRNNGKPATLVSNLSVLIGGLAGAGKSSTIWSIVEALQKVVPIRLRIVDPSGVEFAEAKRRLGDGLVIDYISDPGRSGGRTMQDFWDDITTDFNARLDAVEAAGVRWHRPTKAEPLDVLIIDEILPLAAELSKKTSEHIVARIVFLGRKAGFMCIAASQAGQVDVLGRIRDLFPQRICHRTESRHVTDAFLGPGAEMDGARCSALDAIRDVGIFYMAENGSSGYTCCRSAWVSDKDIERIAQGLRPIPSDTSDIHDRDTSLYALYDADGGLLYVGIAASDRLHARWDEHRRTKPWWPEVADMKEIGSYPDRYLAETAEAMAIKKQAPKYNKQHNTSFTHN